MKLRKSLLIFCLCILAFAFSASAAITVDTVSAEPGQTVSVDITLSGSQSICGMLLTLEYDPALTLTKIERGGALSSLDFTKPNDLKSPVKLLWDGVEADKKTGTLVTLTFRVPSGSGRYPIAATFTPGDIFDANLNDLSVESIPGAIEVGASTAVELQTAVGAQIRTQGTQALRFTSTLTKDDRITEFGTLLIPTDLLSGALTLSTKRAVRVPARYIKSETTKKYTFTAVITHILPKSHTRSYSARAYAILDDGSVVYSDTTSARSVSRVAASAGIKLN